MGDLFRLMRARVPANARREVEAYAAELADYRATMSDPRVSTAMMEFAVMLRRRTIDHAADDRPFTEADLASLEAAEPERGQLGISLDSLRHVLLLHSRYTLTDVHEAAGPDEVGDLLRVIAWLGPQGMIAGRAFTIGYLAGQRQFLPVAARLRHFVGMLVSDDPLVDDFAASLGLVVAEHYLVVALRIADGTPVPQEAARTRMIGALFERYRIPLTWSEPTEIVALVATGGQGLELPPAPPHERALALVQDLADLLGRPFAVGAAAGPTHALAEAVALARRTSHAAPMEPAPRRLHTVADLFVELGVAHVPEADRWLGDLARRLAAGPDLVTTLDCYYRNDMHRLHTARSLNIHPRTLDYRLQRAREMTGMAPGSTQGVRVLSARWPASSRPRQRTGRGDRRHGVVLDSEAVRVGGAVAGSDKTTPVPGGWFCGEYRRPRPRADGILFPRG
jgi:hypothetical protein